MWKTSTSLAATSVTPAAPACWVIRSIRLMESSNCRLVGWTGTMSTTGKNMNCGGELCAWLPSRGYRRQGSERELERPGAARPPPAFYVMLLRLPIFGGKALLDPPRDELSHTRPDLVVRARLDKPLDLLIQLAVIGPIRLGIRALAQDRPPSSRVSIKLHCFSTVREGCYFFFFFFFFFFLSLLRARPSAICLATIAAMPVLRPCQSLFSPFANCLTLASMSPSPNFFQFPSFGKLKTLLMREMAGFSPRATSLYRAFKSVIGLAVDFSIGIDFDVNFSRV